MLALTSGLEMFKINARVYPSSAQGLDSLTNRPSVDPIQKKWIQTNRKIPMDTWG